MRARNHLAVLAFAATTALVSLAAARGVAAPGPDSTRTAPSGSEKSPQRGHPKVVLDRLDLAKAPMPSSEEKYLRDVLAHEAKRADWGAGRESRIQYRFRIDELEVTEEESVVKIRCSATGWLPKGKTAKSRLAFGGSPKERTELVRRVLSIVARGVVTRLAELERQRRLAGR